MVQVFLKSLRRIASDGRVEGAEARLRGLVAVGLEAGPRLRLGPRVEFVNRQRISLGSDVAMAGNSVLNAGGARGRIDIGAKSHLDWFCVIYGQGGVTIGRGCAIAAGVIIYSQTNQYRSDPAGEILAQDTVYAPVTIGDDVWIGAGARVLPGVRIGSHAVIAAGAVVRHDVPEWAIAAGVPARVLRDRRTSPREPNEQLERNGTTHTPS